MPNVVEIGIEVKGDKAKRAYKKLSKTVTAQNSKIINSSKQVEAQTQKQAKEAEKKARVIERAAKKEERIIEKVEREKRRAIKATERAQENAIRNTRILFVAFAGILTGVVGKALIETQRNVDKINNALKVGKGSQQAATIEFAFLAKEAERLGLNLESSALSYAKFTAAAKNSSLTTKAQREIFLGVAEASAALSLSADETNGAMLALQQMMSKGTVQAEELRGQLGERIPGAFGLAAKAMGLTEKALGKQLELGNVLAADLLPKLAIEMRKTFGGTAAEGPEKLNGKINLLNNAFTKLKKGFLEAGGLKFLTAGFGLATAAVKALNVEIDRLDRTKAEKGSLIAGSKEALDDVIALERRLLSLRQIVSSQPKVDLQFDPTTRGVARPGTSVVNAQRKELINIEKELRGILGVNASLEKNAILNHISNQQEELEIIKHKQELLNKEAEAIEVVNQKLRDQQVLFRDFKAVKFEFKLEDVTKPLTETEEILKRLENRVKELKKIGGEFLLIDTDPKALEKGVEALTMAKSFSDQIQAIHDEARDSQDQKDKEAAADRISRMQFFVNSVSQMTNQLSQLSTIGIENQIKSIQLADKQANREKSLGEAKTSREKTELKEQFAKEDKIQALRKKAFDRQQKFALLQAAIDTAGGLINALTIKPAALIPAAQFLALATGAAQTAVISQQKFARGGVVDGPRSGDTVPIMANGGERVLTARQNQTFERMIDGGGQQVSFGDTIINVSGNGDPSAIASAVVQTRQEQIRMFGDTTKRTNSLQVRTI